MIKNGAGAVSWSTSSEPLQIQIQEPKPGFHEAGLSTLLPGRLLVKPNLSRLTRTLPVPQGAGEYLCLVVPGAC